jgi:hypothetical protein
VEEHRQALKAKEAENISRITAASRELSAASRELSVKTIADNLAVSKALLEKTHANSEKTLNGQDAMRSEFKGLIDELHDSVKAVKSATSANETTAKAIATQVTALGTVSKDIHAEVKKAVKNTSTVTAVLVGLGVGFLAGLPANYVYERHFSVDAMNKKAEAARRDKDTAGASAPPPPGNDKGESFVALPYSGLADPLTGKNLMDLFNEGNTVRLLKQDGSSICLQMPKPIPCVGAEVPKQQPKAVVPPVHPEKAMAPRHRLHHVRRHRPNNGCAR